MPEATVLKMAEELIPRLRVAEWLDRAEAAKRQLAHLDLRDLRSVVVASDDPVVARDEATRELAAELKAALVTKQEEELQLWLADVEAPPRSVGWCAPSAVGAAARRPGCRSRRRSGRSSASSPTPRSPRTIPPIAGSPCSRPPPSRPSARTCSRAAFPPWSATICAPPSCDWRRLLPQVAALFGVEAPTKAAMPKPLRRAAAQEGSGQPAPERGQSPGSGASGGSSEAGEVAAPRRRPPSPRPTRRGRGRRRRRSRPRRSGRGRSAAVEAETPAVEPSRAPPSRRRQPSSRRRQRSRRRRRRSGRDASGRGGDATGRAGDATGRAGDASGRGGDAEPSNRSPPSRTSSPPRPRRHEAEPAAAADTATADAAGSEADPTAGLAADEAELPTFAE